MLLSLRSLGLIALGLASLVPACGASNAELLVIDDTGVPGPNATIAFDEEGTLTLAPGEVVAVTVHTSPPAPYEIAFFLKGAALDASLGATVVVAAPDGSATVQLKAPNAATSFALRAKIKDGPAVDLLVAVSDKGFGTLHVVPVYEGQRETREWVASVASGTSCAALAAIMPEDPEGALTAVAEPPDPLLVPDVPVGPTLAVFVRGGHYMWGCSDVPSLGAGTTLDVAVPIVPKPLDLSATLLDVDLAFAPDPGPWNAMLEGALAASLDALLAPGPTDAYALVVAMKERSPDPAAFLAAAQVGGWFTLLATHFAQNGIDLRAFVTTHALAGLGSAPPLVSGELSSVGADGVALFTLGALGPVSADEGGIPADYLVSWSADSFDDVNLGGTLFWLPSRLVAVAAEHALPPATSMANALASEVECATVASLLAGYGACDAGCLQLLCEDALAERWLHARDVSAVAGQIGTIALQALGLAEFDDVAAITAFSGSWVGQVSDGVSVAQVSGAASGVKPMPPTP
ncbi:MAG: hypothetical protein HY908_25745 [Myxococcales bacterium]|nr:hypothetical protein [Myxococcales bacterium]